MSSSALYDKTSHGSSGGGVSRAVSPSRWSCSLRSALIALLCCVASIPLLLTISTTHPQKGPDQAIGLTSKSVDSNPQVSSIKVPKSHVDSKTMYYRAYNYSQTEYNDIAKRLEKSIVNLKRQVRELRDSHTVLMPIDSGAMALTNQLQDVTRCSLIHRYKGHVNRPIVMKIGVSFPQAMVDRKLGPLFAGNMYRVHKA
jgi:hypothetical protein